jgi:hypothetical protein
MKTILYVNSAGKHYFKRTNGSWQSIEKPDQSDHLWVIANMPEEMVTEFKIPGLYGRDRNIYLERNLKMAFPNSEYRCAPQFAGNWFTPGIAVLNGLTTADAVNREIEKLEISVTGVWGISVILALMLNKLSIKNVIVALHDTLDLRIVVLKNGIPIITRCIHRYIEDTESDAREIIRTRQHIENKRIFENNAIPDVIYLGDTTSVSEQLSAAGIRLLPLPGALLPKGKVAYLHPIFELLITSPIGQLAPLQLRARHQTQRLRHLAHAGSALSLLVALFLSQSDFNNLINLRHREQSLEGDLKKATLAGESLAASISKTGIDPELVRQATTFQDIELESASTPLSILQFTASLITDFPQVRIKELIFRFPEKKERYCETHTVINLPVIAKNVTVPLNIGSKPVVSTMAQQRYTELKFSILQTDNPTPATNIELLKRLSAIIKAKPGVQLMQDPAEFSLLNTLKGGIGADTPQNEKYWCMSIPWHTDTDRKEP